MKEIVSIIIIIIIIIIIPIFTYLLFKRESNNQKYNDILPSCVLKNQKKNYEIELFDRNIPIYSISCIDFRFDYLTALFFGGIGLQNLYFTATSAGASLSLGYNCACSSSCSSSSTNKDMNLLRDNLVKNLEIALTLQPITKLYLINHQDCGAIRAFLSCSGYPDSLGSNNEKEIEINSIILKNAKIYLLKKFPNKKITLGLIDVNGTVSNYNVLTNKWTKIFIGSGNNPKGLWYN